jgi:hypothetical protein
VLDATVEAAHGEISCCCCCCPRLLPLPYKLSERNGYDIQAAFGLREEESIYSALLVDEWEVLLHDPFHLWAWVMGLLSLFLSIFAQSLTSNALAEINWLLSHAKPWFWVGSMPVYIPAYNYQWPRHDAS